MLQDSNFLIFIIISFVGAGMMQFYFLGTAQFMQDNGIAPKNVPAAMADCPGDAGRRHPVRCSAGWSSSAGYKWTLTIGAACWLILYVIYVARSPPG